MLYDIKNYAGDIIGSADFPDNMPSELIQEKLAEYAKPLSISSLTTLQRLEIKSVEYMGFGSKLYSTIAQKVWAINVLAASGGNPLTTNQMTTLLSTSDLLEKCLKSGSLATAKVVLISLVQAFPQYSDVGNFATSEINLFLGI